MKENSKVIVGSFPNLLCVLFIGLKLTEKIDWNWFWVLSPMIISVVIVGTINGIVQTLKERKYQNERM